MTIGVSRETEVRKCRIVKKSKRRSKSNDDRDIEPLALATPFAVDSSDPQDIGGEDISAMSEPGYVASSARPSGPVPLPSTRTQPVTDSLASIEEASTQGAFVVRVANLLGMQFQFALSSSDDLYVYRDGAYSEIDDGWLRDAILERLPGRSRHRYSIKARVEIVEQLKAHKPRLWERGCPTGEMAVANGILDFSTGELVPHSPRWLSRLKLPMLHQPGVECPAWNRFLREVFPVDAIDLAWEIVGSCMTTDQLVQEAIWLKGEGGNGKSTLMKAIEGLIGKDNTCTIPIKELATDRFATSTLQGKLLLMDHDTPVDMLKDVTVFKKLTAHDEIRAQAKFGHAFSFFPFAKVLMASNCSPIAQDTTYGFLRRLVVVPFDGIMAGAGSGGRGPRIRQQSEIIAELTTPGEMSGALNQAILGWQRVRRQGGFTLPMSVQEEIDDFRVDADPIRRFVDLRLAAGNPKVDWISAEEVEAEYVVWAKQTRSGRRSRGAITQWVKMNLRGEGVVAGRGKDGGGGGSGAGGAGAGGGDGRIRRGYWGLKWR